MIQAHKTLDAAAAACNPGGTILLLAECEDGLGRSDFADWFSAADSGELAMRLCENYAVNGQTAWSLLRKAETYDVKVLTSLPGEICKKMRLSKLSSIDEAMSTVGKRLGYIIPVGSKLRIVAADES
jgi:nickel-dependent lactate racemase